MHVKPYEGKSVGGGFCEKEGASDLPIMKEQGREDTGLEEALTIRSDDVSLSRAHPAAILLIFLAHSFPLECLAPCPTLGKLNIL